VALATLGFEVTYTRGALDYLCEGAMQLEYGRSGLLQFIGFACHELTVPTYAGVDVFSVTAYDLFRLISKGEGSVPHLYNRHGFRFPVQILTLWDADTQYDHRTHRTREIWGEVGIGSAEYLSAVEALSQ
jgi:hypothetical protein